ncbi:MAG: SCO family protein [Gemmatimonadaceae bacterium]
MRELVLAWRRTAAATLALCAIAGALIAFGTDGFRALTSEQARRNAIARDPRRVPEVTLEDQDGRRFTFAEYRGQPFAVNFVYTRCRALCTVSSAGFERLDREERSRAAAGTRRLELVSVSFDSSDTPERLRDYASRHSADGRRWRFARIRDAGARAAFLETFGIVVIPMPPADFQHNAAVHLVDAEGRLARVLDLDATALDVSRALESMSDAERVARAAANR